MPVGATRPLLGLRGDSQPPLAPPDPSCRLRLRRPTSRRRPGLLRCEHRLLADPAYVEPEWTQAADAAKRSLPEHGPQGTGSDGGALRGLLQCRGQHRLHRPARRARPPVDRGHRCARSTSCSAPLSTLLTSGLRIGHIDRCWCIDRGSAAAGGPSATEHVCNEVASPCGFPSPKLESSSRSSSRKRGTGQAAPESGPRSVGLRTMRSAMLSSRSPRVQTRGEQAMWNGALVASARGRGLWPNDSIC